MPVAQIVLPILFVLAYGSQLVAGDTNLSKEVCHEFGEQLIKAIESQDPAACRKLYDTGVFVERMFENLEFRFSDRETERKKWKQRFADSHVLYQSLLTTVANGGTVSLLSVHPDRAKDQLVIRVVNSDGAFDYQLLSLSESESGQILVTDLAGVGGAPSGIEFVMTTIARFTPTDGPDGKTIKDVPNAERIILDKKALGGMNQEFARNDFATVLHFYGYLSPDLKKDKYPLLMAAAASVRMEPGQDGGTTVEQRDATADSLIRTYRRAYPNDPNIEMVALGHYMNRNRFELALLAIDAIDKHVGGDPYLDAIRATVYLRSTDYDVARKKSDAAVAALPDVVPVHSIAAEVAVRQRDFAGAVKVLDTMETKFGKTLVPDPADDDAWKSFFSSDEYRAWDANHE
jgi:hypothetical protein